MNQRIESLLTLAALLSDEHPTPAAQNHPAIGKYCTIRTRDAGVHVGTVISVDGINVELGDARRLWKWSGAFTLNEVSGTGIDPADSRMSAPVPTIYLTQAIEILPVSESAKKTMDACHE